VRNRRRPYRDFEDDEPDSLGETLAAVNDRLDDLTRQIARVARRSHGESYGEERDVSISIGEALAHFDRRLDQIIDSERAGSSAVHRDREDRQRQAPDWIPPQQPLPSEATRGQDLSGLENQLRQITQQIAALQQPYPIDDVVDAFRSELSEIGRVLNEAVPRQAIEALEREVRALAERVDRSRDDGADAAKLAQLEKGLAEVRDSLRALKPAENLVEINAAVSDLARRIDQMNAANQTPAALQKLDQTVSGLRVIVSHVASNDTVGKLADEIRGLSSRLEHAIAESNAKALSNLDRQIASLIDSGRAGTADSEGLIKTFSEQFDKRFAALIDTTRASAVDSETLVKALGEQLDQRMSALTSSERPGSIDGETLIRTLSEHFDQRITALINNGRALSAESQNLAKSLAAQLDQRIAALSNSGRNGSAESETLIKTLAAQLDQRIAALAANTNTVSQELKSLIGALSASNSAVSEELKSLTSTLSQQLNPAQLSQGDKLALSGIEERISGLAGKLNNSEALLGRLDAIERGMADLMDHLEKQSLMARLEEQRRKPQEAAQAPQQDRTEERREETAEQPIFERRQVPRYEPRMDGIRDEADATAFESSTLIPAEALTEAKPETEESESGPTYTLAQATALLAHPDATGGTATVTKTEPAHQPARQPINPDLPPDTPIEPSSEPIRRASAAERITASEQALGGAKPAVREVASQFETLIAARRAAFAAGNEAAPAVATQLKTSPAARPETSRGRMGSYLRWLLFAASVVIILLGAVRVAVEMWPMPEPVVLTPAPVPEASPAPAPTTAPTPAPEPTKQEPAKPMPMPTPMPMPAPDSAPDDGPGSPPANSAPTPPNPPADAVPNDADKHDPLGDSGHRSMPEVTGALTPNDAPLGRTPTGPALPVTIGGPVLRAAAAAGNPAAEYEIAVRYAEGRGVTINIDEAALWLERAAKSGFAPAQFRLGGLYDKGGGLKRDRTLAQQLYAAAAEKGHAKAMHNLAVLYAEGIDGKPNYRLAAQWFRKAAEYGIGDSQYNLAILYVRGIGVEQNFAESYKWFALAANQGDQEAARKRDEVADRLDEQALKTAQLAVQGFRPAQQPEQAISLRIPLGGWDQSNTTAQQPAKINVHPSPLPNALLSPAPL